MCSAVRRRMLSKGTISSPAARDGRAAPGPAAPPAGAGARRGRGRGTAGARRVEHVVARDAAAFAAAADRRRVETLLVDQPAHDRRRHRAAAVRGGRGCGHGGAGRRGRGSGRGRGRRCGRDGRRAEAAAGAGARRGRAGAGGAGGAGAGTSVGDHREARADRHRLALLHDDLGDEPGLRRGHLGVDLVGRHLEQRLVRVDLLADLLEPLRDRALGDRLTELRHRDVHGAPLTSRLAVYATRERRPVSASTDSPNNSDKRRVRVDQQAHVGRGRLPVHA